MAIKKQSIKLSDFYRILVSETSPVDTPIIFTNNWLYQNIKNKSKKKKCIQDCIGFLFEKLSIEPDTMPMRYKIRKDETSYRHMGIIHPSSQVNFIEFYKKYSPQILYYCDASPFSIRRPAKIASSYYLKNRRGHLKAPKGSSAQRISDEKKFRHATSYYSYDRYTKLYQFFEDEEFFKLEEKFTDFWSIDISKCFDSIYTHSISWATKRKHNAKKHITNDAFGDAFDKLMQRSNFNETNGIIIGNEVSRIFAEVILQAVDKESVQSLEKKSTIIGVDYEVRRYVDDYFIFASSNIIAQKVYNAIEDSLRKFKLYINKSKTKKQTKPFVTGITRAKLDTSTALTNLYDLLFYRVVDEDKINTFVKSSKKDIIRNKHLVINKFVNSIKSSSYQDSDAYNVMTGYIISALANKSIELSSTTPKEITSYAFITYRDAFLILLRIAFHLFSVTPSFANSFKLSTLCYTSFVFFEKHFKNEEKTIKLMINNLIREFFESGKCQQLLSKDDTYFPVELANLLFISRVMGSDYLLTQKQVKDIFNLENIKKRSSDFLQQEENSDYFQLTSLLYYIGDEPNYESIKKEAIKLINQRLKNLNNIAKDTKLCLLFLDSMSCPYIDSKDKKNWTKTFSKILYKKDISESNLQELLSALSDEQWFISWNYLDLWNTLEKKELIFEY
ncbi:MAG: RNA-directed DNA polymerase [Oceanospirillales bacterium]|nr:RNA-directed DNA polymerase [Oceanospirillales bacterium]MBR9887738.1 RNA-directed DNA polymerase [Oceanospirillales bacterium]